MPMTKLDRGDGVQLACDFTPGASPTLVFLPGFMSDMTGDKAVALAELAAQTGHACLRLDYSGHGASGGNFADGTIGRWASDALAALTHFVPGPFLLVGSSMGGWIALLLALRLPERLTALVGIAAAPDFTATILPALTQEQRDNLARDGEVRIPSAYGGEQIFTAALIEDGRQHLLLHQPIPLTCPVRLLHGMQDPDVPWQTSLKIAERLSSGDVRVTLIKDAGHRLSRPEDIAVLTSLVRPLLSVCPRTSPGGHLGRVYGAPVLTAPNGRSAPVLANTP